MVPPPSKRPRTGLGRVGHVGNSGLQGAGSSRLDELPTGGSRGPTNNIPSGTSERPAASMDNHHPASPVEAPVPPRQCRQAVNAVDDETADVQGVMVDMTNPKQGPTTGGPEIWVSGWNFPTDLRPLYVRFGNNPVCAVGVPSPPFVTHLIASRPFENMTYSRAFCRKPVFQARLK